jgi:U3 small nucleolar RNA-associated protein 24
MDLLFAKCHVVVTDCIMAELEKLGPKYRLALKLARDPRWKRIKCDHKVYGDDCLHDLVKAHRVYLVGTNDKALKQRIRKIPGVPIVSVGRGRFTIEKLPEQL